MVILGLAVTLPLRSSPSHHIRLEQQIAKEEFERQQQELEREKQLAEQRRKEQHARSMADQEAKKRAEEEKQERRRRAWMHQQRQLEEMRANDDRRKEIRNLQKQQRDADMAAKRKFKEDRIALSKSNLADKTGDKMAAFMAKQNHEQAREDRLNNLRLLQQEEGARRGPNLVSPMYRYRPQPLLLIVCYLFQFLNHDVLLFPTTGFQVMMKRKAIMDEADRKQEEKRQQIIEHQNEVEHRMMLHEMKKERSDRLNNFSIFLNESACILYL